MAALQSLDKRATIKTCADLSQHFSDTILQKHEDCDELHLVFDRYDVPLSLKTATRVRRQGEGQPVSYQVSDTTHIAKVPMKRQLSHTRTKMEITKYLSAKLIHISQQRTKSLVVPWASEYKATQRCQSPSKFSGRSWHKDDSSCAWCSLEWSNRNQCLLPGYRRVRPLVKTILQALYRSPLCHWNKSTPSSDQLAAHCRPLAGLGLRHYLPFMLSEVRTSLAALLTRGSSLGGKYSKMVMKQPLMPYPNSEQEAYQQQTPWLSSKSWCVDCMFTPKLKLLVSYDGHCSARSKHNLRNHLLHKWHFVRPLWGQTTKHWYVVSVWHRVWDTVSLCQIFLRLKNTVGS